MVLIISILAAVSIPRLTKAALGTLRVQLQLYKLANNRYPKNAVEFASSEYYNPADMKCTYVDDSCFDYKSTKTGYTLICSSKYAGNAGNVIGTYYKAGKVADFKNLKIEITITEKGVFTEKYY